MNLDSKKSSKICGPCPFRSPNLFDNVCYNLLKLRTFKCVREGLP